MAIYNIFAEIKTNASPDDLYYEMELYKKDWIGHKTYALRPTGKHPISVEIVDTEKKQMHPATDHLGNPIKRKSSQTIYKTQQHPSLNIDDPVETCYILSIDIYRKVGVDYIKITQEEPMTAIVPLEGFLLPNNKDYAPSRSFEYYETTQQTQKSQDGQINTVQLNISSKPRIFEAKEHPIGDPLDPFTKQMVEDQLKVRIKRPVPSIIRDAKLLGNLSLKEYQEQQDLRWPSHYPNQDRSMLCGPAAFFYCLLMDRVDIYQQIIKELWESGKTKIGTLSINPSKGTRHPKNFFYENNNTRVPVIDWITLASLRDTETIFSINKPTGILVNLSSITIAGTIEKWFHKVGSKTVFDNIKYHRHSKLSEICELNKYISSSHHVVTLISAGMLMQGAKSAFKDHWIVWDGKLKIKKDQSEVTTSTSLSETVQLRLFSWGITDEWLEADLTLEQFLKHTFGGMVFTKIP